MVRNIFLILIFVNFCNSCNAQKCEFKTLLNKTTKVPKDFEACFKSKKFVTSNIIDKINTDCIYEQIGDIYNRYSVIKFYPNGKLNYYSFKFGFVYNETTFDPSINGLRGFVVQKIQDKNYYIQFYTIINHSGDWGIKTEKIEVFGDELHLISKSGYRSVFKKKIVPKEFLSYKPNW